MYDSILVATDGDVSSENAVDHAVSLAAASDATLHALFVVDSDVYSAYSGDEYVDEHEGIEHALEGHGREALEEVERKASEAGVELVDALQHGTPSEEIVSYANERDVDLVVLGTKHHPEPYRRLLGSVTDRVVRLSERPVTIVKTPVAKEE